MLKKDPIKVHLRQINNFLVTPDSLHVSWDKLFSKTAGQQKESERQTHNLEAASMNLGNPTYRVNVINEPQGKTDPTTLNSIPYLTSSPNSPISIVVQCDLLSFYSSKFFILTLHIEGG